MGAGVDLCPGAGVLVELVELEGVVVGLAVVVDVASVTETDAAADSATAPALSVTCNLKLHVPVVVLASVVNL